MGRPCRGKYELSIKRVWAGGRDEEREVLIRVWSSDDLILFESQWTLWSTASITVTIAQRSPSPPVTLYTSLHPRPLSLTQRNSWRSERFGSSNYRQKGMESREYVNNHSQATAYPDNFTLDHGNWLVCCEQRTGLSTRSDSTPSYTHSRSPPYAPREVLAPHRHCRSWQAWLSWNGLGSWWTKS